MQPEKTQTKVLPREVPTISPPRVPFTVPPLRVPAKVTLPRVMTTRVPMITQEDTVEDTRKRERVEHNNQHQLKNIYPTKITQLSQGINQVESAATTLNRHQHWLMNTHEKVKAAP